MQARHAARLTGAALLAAALAACSSTSVQPLAPGLTLPMNQPGAQLDRVQALFLLNDFRKQSGARELRGDTVLESAAQSLADTYAKTGVVPQVPANVLIMRTSAGYNTFAETFSGWRSSPVDAAELTDPRVARAGLGVTYNEKSQYGVFWVLLLDD